jgi:predicted transglutaminase-like cysteine proteinase
MLRNMIVAMALMFMATNAFADSASFFNSTEQDLGAEVVSWKMMNNRRTHTPPPLCLTLFSKKCAPELRDEFIQGLVGKDKSTQLYEVNHYFNSFPYVTDQMNYGIKDFWATPDEFLRRGGDCEDYAIAKYFALKRLGWLDGDMRIVVVRQKDRKTAHAVLVVRNQGYYMVLDNLRRAVYDANLIDYYEAVYSVNEAGEWLHTSNGA